jgi:hypothetical protein
VAADLDHRGPDRSDLRRRHGLDIRRALNRAAHNEDARPIRPMVFCVQAGSIVILERSLSAAVSFTGILRLM